MGSDRPKIQTLEGEREIGGEGSGLAEEKSVEEEHPISGAAEPIQHSTRLGAEQPVQPRLPPRLATVGADHDVKVGCPCLSYPYPLSSTAIAALRFAPPHFGGVVP
jgi:hypothetical protein